MLKPRNSLIAFICLLFLSGCSKSAQSLLDDDKRAATYAPGTKDLMPVSEENKLSNRTKFSIDGSRLLGMSKSDLSRRLGDADELGFQCAGIVFAEENCAKDKHEHERDVALQYAAGAQRLTPKSEESWFSTMLSFTAKPAKKLLYSMPLDYVRIYWLHDGSSRAFATHALAISMLNNHAIRSATCWSIGPVDNALGLAVCVLIVLFINSILTTRRHIIEKRKQNRQHDKSSRALS